MDLTQASDVELVDALAHGDATALAEFNRRYHDRMLLLAKRVLGQHDGAEDVVQEAYLRLHRSADRYRPTARFSTWLYRIVLNLCRDRLRQVQRRPLELKIDAPDKADSEPAVRLEKGETALRIRQAVQALPERQRIAFVLHRYRRQSHQEIARSTGWSTSAIESLLSRAYQQLRDSLRDLV